MRAAVNGLTALRALRVFRGSRAPLAAERVPPPPPDPSPRRRWCAGLLPLERLALDEPPSAERPVELVVARAGERVQARFVTCSVHPTRLPADSFVDLGDGLFAPCPELLFLQLSRVMMPEALALVGYELCGTYARDPRDPQGGDVTYDVPPATSASAIASYLDACGVHAGVMDSRRMLARVRDDSWSPMESVIALLATLPVHELGYEFGDIVLNVRRGASPELVALGVKESRAPDIEVAGTHVGFNYDGRGHLDLESIVAAAATGDATRELQAVREKNYDDIKRDRELAAGGRIIFPMVSQDLYAPGGLDAVMLEAAQAIHEIDGRSLANIHAAMCEPYQSRRQRLVWALLPWGKGVEYARAHAVCEPWVFGGE